MITLNSLLVAILCACSTWYSAQAILVEGSRWTLDKKEILFLFDIHNEPGFEDRERQELKTFIEILKFYSETDSRPLYILIEETANTQALLGPLRELLAQERFTFKNIIVENIEQRAASAAASDLLSEFPDHQYLWPRTSATQTCSAQKVTMQEVLDEFNGINAYVEESCCHASEMVKSIHDERMGDVTYFRRKIMDRIKELSLSVDKPLASLVENCTTEELDRYRGLGKLIFTVASAYMDLYAFHRVLLLPDDYRVVLLAGDAHCDWVKSEMMGSLDAIKCFGHGTGLILKDETIQPLQAEQLKSLICT